MKLKKIAHLIALIGVVSPAVAQEVQPQTTPMARVEITGSSIKRVAKEGALPVRDHQCRNSCKSRASPPPSN